MSKNNGVVIWLAVAAGLLGAAQQVFIVLLPIMSDRFNIAYGTLVNIQAIGSFLFIFSTPYWAKLSDVRTSDDILTWGVIGYLLSFVVVTVSWLLMDFEHVSATTFLVCFLISRFIYGWYASAIIPQVQNWSLRLKANSSVAALARVNLGGTLARMLSPIIASVLIFIHPIFALLLPLLLATGVRVKLLTQSVQDETLVQNNSTLENEGRSLVESSFFLVNVPLLMLAFITSLSLALALFSLAPLAISRFTLSSEQSAIFVAYALTLSAVMTSIGQYYFSRKQRLQTAHLMKLGVALTVASALIVSQSRIEIVVIVAMACLSLGCNWMTLSYSAKLVETKNKKATSWVSMLHTLGYGSAAIMFNVLTEMHFLIIAILIFSGFLSVRLVEKLMKPAVITAP